MRARRRWLMTPISSSSPFRTTPSRRSRGRWAGSKQHSVIHCSGATEVSALAAAADQGASIGGFHPLQTFTNTEAAMQTLPGCTAGIEAEDESLLNLLWAMAQALGCNPIRLPPGSRALYHASGSFAASFLVALINDALDLWYAFGVDREDAFRALLPLTKGTVAALEANGPVKSLAGPIARADVGTVERHMAALRAQGAAPAADLPGSRAPQPAHLASQGWRQPGETRRAQGVVGAAMMEARRLIADFGWESRRACMGC